MPVIIGITGASGSGKSSIAQAIVQDLSHELRVHVLAEDHYYHDLGRLPGFDPFQYNFDEPKSKDYVTMCQNLAAFSAGNIVDMPLYDHAIHARTGKTAQLNPALIDVLILEGIHVLWDQAVRDCLDLKVYIDTPLDECLARRINRDITERGRDVHEVLWRFRNHVRPAHHTYTAPTKVYADITIHEAGDTPLNNNLHQPVLDWCRSQKKI